MDAEKLPAWLNEIEDGTVAVLTLVDGERLRADVLRLDDDDQLVVDVISSNRRYDTSAQQNRIIPVKSVVSVELKPRAEQPWPYNDPCRVVSSSFGRIALLSTLFLGMTMGAIPLFLFLPKRPYGLQAASAIVYTMAVVFFTFARTGPGNYNWSGKAKDLPPYRFTCPAVQTQIPHLLWRHLGFLIGLFALQTLRKPCGRICPFGGTWETATTTAHSTSPCSFCLSSSGGRRFSLTGACSNARTGSSPRNAATVAGA